MLKKKPIKRKRKKKTFEQVAAKILKQPPVKEKDWWAVREEERLAKWQRDCGGPKISLHVFKQYAIDRPNLWRKGDGVRVRPNVVAVNGRPLIVGRWPMTWMWSVELRTFFLLFHWNKARVAKFVTGQPTFKSPAWWVVGFCWRPFSVKTDYWWRSNGQEKP